MTPSEPGPTKLVSAYPSASDLGYLLFLAVALPLSSLRLLALPETQVSLAPLFFLLATVRWGYRRGAIAALLLTLPGLWLWGPSARPLIAVGQVLALSLIQRRRRMMLAEATTLYYLVVAPLWFLLPGRPHSISFVILLMVDYVILQALFAATIDMLSRSLALQPAFPFLILRKRRSLGGVIRAAINFAVFLLFQTALMSQVDIQARAEQRFRAVVHEAAAKLAASHARDPSAADRTLPVPMLTHAKAELFLSKAVAGFDERARQALGPACGALMPYRSSKGRLPSAGVSRCETAAIDVDGRPVRLAIRYDHTPIDHFSWFSVELLMLLFAGAFALLFRITVTRQLTQSLDLALDMVARFGTAGLRHAGPGGFREFERPLREFVDRNNVYVAAIEERERLSQSFLELERSLSLRILSDIEFDPASGRLRFLAERTSGTPAETVVPIHASDCALFASASGNDEVTIEYRTAESAEIETFLITLQQAIGGHRWAKGLVFRLRQPQHLREVMSRHARLADLGNMAALISHEMKQPLFTILMAAEKIHLLLAGSRPPPVERIARQATTIASQVGRARAMIRHISRYSQADTAEAVNVGEVAKAARSFLQPLLDEKAIGVVEEIRRGKHRTIASRVALEQVIVNAIQNAVDAIEIARETGRDAGTIRLIVVSSAESVCCTIADDGIGLEAGVDAIAFAPFFTTKPSDKSNGLGLFISRQIIVELGGTILLSDNPPHGAQLQITLPAASAG